VEVLEEQFTLASELAETAKTKRDEKQRDVTDLKVRLETDESEQFRLRLEEKINYQLDLISAYQHPEVARANRLINALRELINDHNFLDVAKIMQKSIDTLVNARSDDNP